MPELLTISTQEPAEPALHYQELRRRGIAYIQDTASAFWTDYNVHDPGITTLELLCYAITDLSYRASFSVPDLLATEKDTVENIRKHFITAKNIFPNQPTTNNDYRKLLIDIGGVKNAWIARDTKTIYADLINKTLSYNTPSSRKWKPVTLKGYHRILLEFDTNVEDAEKESIRQQARGVLASNRNVCEDFTTVSEVQRESLRLCAEIEIAPQADPVELLARVFFNIQQHLTPIVRFYRLAELFEQKYSADKIFEGPLLSHGFIKNDELDASELKTEIHLSDIMQQILNAQGVLNIDEIVVTPVQEVNVQSNKWIIGLKSGHQPVMDILESKIVVYKNGMPFRPRPQDIEQRFRGLMQAFIEGNEAVITEDISFNTGTFRHIGQYYSIQNHYPKTYGISHWGLPDDATPERKAQARQLQGFLYFFDQQLANYLAQLSNLSKLFSTDPTIDRTYFTQLADSFKDAEDLFADPLGVKERIQEAAESPDSFDQRRNTFIDHLLSRFSESFYDYVGILRSISPEMNRQELIDTKLRFVNNYPEYSSRRFAAFNKAATDQWDTDNISGLEKRLQRLLGFKDIKRRSLVNVYSEVNGITVNGIENFSFQLIDNRSKDSLLVSSGQFPSAETAGRALNVLWESVLDLARYSIVSGASGQFNIVVKDAAGEVLAVASEPFSSNEAAVNGIAALHQLLTINQSEEGMFLVENILLLPDASLPASPLSPPDPASFVKGFMTVCTDENCEDCEVTDPYSFRLSIILPAYSQRFLNMDFRHYCERVIRMETPAHLFPRICWVNNEQLHEFEDRYQEWLKVQSGHTTDDDNSILEGFINILTSLRTVHPPARLQDCSGTELRKLFLLNKNALGTLNT